MIRQKDKQTIIDALVKVLIRVPKEVDYEKMIAYAEGEITATKIKKDRLLDLHIAGAITTPEFKERNDALNVQLKNQESQLVAIRQEQTKVGSQNMDVDAIGRKLEKELSFTDGINTALVATILDKVIVKKESTKEEIHLEILLKLGHKYEAIYSPQTFPASINPPRPVDARRSFLWRTIDQVVLFSIALPSALFKKQHQTYSCMSGVCFTLLFFCPASLGINVHISVCHIR